MQEQLELICLYYSYPKYFGNGNFLWKLQKLGSNTENPKVKRLIWRCCWINDNDNDDGEGWQKDDGDG